MALMPMPPMPMMWNGLRRGESAWLVCPVLAPLRCPSRRPARPAPVPIRLLDEVGEPSDGVGPALALCRPGRACERRRVSRKPLDLTRQPLGRQLLLLDTPAPPRFGKIGCILKLIVVKRMRQRNEDRRAADDGELGHGRGPGAGDDEMACRHPRGQILEEGLRPRPRCRPPHRRSRPGSRSSSRACCVTLRRPLRRRRGAASAGGTTSEKIARALAAAEDEQAKLAARQPADRKALGRLDDDVAHRVACETGLGELSPSTNFVVSNEVAIASHRFASVCWRGRARRSARAARTGCRAGAPQSAAERSDSRRSR